MSPNLFCNKCGAPNAAESQFCSRCGTALNPTVGATSAPSVSNTAPAVSYRAVPATGTGYGGFWIRLVAFIIDAIIVRIPVQVVATIFGVSGFAMGFGRHEFPHTALPFMLFGGGVLAVLTVAGSWLYEAFMLSSPYQATLGKMIFGMKVTDLYGNRISFARATGRHFAKWLSGIILCIGYIMAGFTDRKQGLHDMLAGTLVRK